MITPIFICIMNFGGKLSIHIYILWISANPSIAKENLSRKDPLFRECWTQKPTHIGSVQRYPQHAMYLPRALQRDNGESKQWMVFQFTNLLLKSPGGEFPYQAITFLIVRGKMIMACVNLDVTWDCRRAITNKVFFQWNFGVATNLTRHLTQDQM